MTYKYIHKNSRKKVKAWSYQAFLHQYGCAYPPQSTDIIFSITRCVTLAQGCGHRGYLNTGARASWEGRQLQIWIWSQTIQTENSRRTLYLDFCKENGYLNAVLQDLRLHCSPVWSCCFSPLSPHPSLMCFRSVSPYKQTWCLAWMAQMS